MSNSQSIRMKMRKLFTLAIASFLVTTTAFSMSHKKQDIVDVASKAGSFNTLIAAAKAAGLIDALKGDGPLTVFAPTDDAFAKLPEGTVETLLKPENKDKLKSILLYHVVAGSVMAETAVTLDSARTLQGSSFSIMLDGKTLKIDGAAVTQADIKASNGVIHVIDSVILPKS